MLKLTEKFLYVNRTKFLKYFKTYCHLCAPKSISFGKKWKSRKRTNSNLSSAKSLKVPSIFHIFMQYLILHHIISPFIFIQNWKKRRKSHIVINTEVYMWNKTFPFANKEKAHCFKNRLLIYKLKFTLEIFSKIVTERKDMYRIKWVISEILFKHCATRVLQKVFSFE